MTILPVTPSSTLAAAFAAAAPLLARGEAVTLRLTPGLYREEIVLEKDNDTPLIIESAMPGEAVLCGSDLWTGWTPAPDLPGAWQAAWPHRWGWFANPWPRSLPMPVPGFRRELAFLDGLPLRQVLEPDELDPGCYLVHEATSRLILRPPGDGPAPDRAPVEVSIRPLHGNHLLHVLHARSITLRGLVFRHASHPLESGALCLDHSRDILIEECVFEWNNSGGLEFAHASDITVRRVRADHNGTIGIGAHFLDRIALEDVSACYNNWRGERWGVTGWFTAGLKFLDVNDVSACRVRTDHNRAIGFWLDTDISRTRIEDLSACDNWEEGMHLEAADGPIHVARATICRNRKAGLAGRDCDGVRLEDCLIANNVGAQIEIKGELPRGEADAEQFRGRGKTRDQHRRLPRDWSIHRCNIGTLLAGHRPLLAIELKGINQSPERAALLHEGFTGTLRSEDNTWFAPPGAPAFPGTAQTALDLQRWSALHNLDHHSRWAKEPFEDGCLASLGGRPAEESGPQPATPARDLNA